MVRCAATTRTALVTALGTLAACSFSGGSSINVDAAVDIPDATVIDGNEQTIDAPAMFDCADLDARHVDPCAAGGPIGAPAGEPLEALTIDGECTYDTTVGELDCDETETMLGQVDLPQDTGPTLAVLLFESFTVSSGATLRIVGDKPLVVASATEIAIAGLINVGSSRGDNGAANPGAGVDSIDHCTVTDDAGAAGGGGGGGMADLGGVGGDGDNGATGGTAGGALAAIPTGIVVGCPGAPGHDRANAAVGLAGTGGGALELVALTSIEVTGTITAGGMSGGPTGETEEIGGGGGGSGGYLGFDAPVIVFAATAIIAANGGGGGEGSDNAQGEGGNAGTSGLASDTAAAGGTGGGAGGDGGNGSAAATLVGAAGANSVMQGGGGGGGAAGFILVSGTVDEVAGSVVSPDDQPMP
jgi:hypothetical protein